MLKYKLPKEVKKRMEREFRQYWKNKKKLKDLELQIIEASTRGNGQAKTGTNSDSTSQKAIKLLSTRSILYCQERIQYIENAINRLNPSEEEVFMHIFKESCDWLYCETNYNVSKSTYYNVYNKSLYYLAEEWGEV